MYCANCGKKMNDSDKYCASCGKEIISSPAEEKKPSAETQEVSIPSDVSPETGASGQETYVKPKQVSVLWVIVAAVGLIGALAAILIPAFLGSTIPPSSYFGMSVWIGIFTALYGKRKGKSGWRWFFIGFLGIGFTLAFLISFMSAFLSNRNNIDKQLFKISAFRTLSDKDPTLYEKLKKDITGIYKTGKLDNAKLYEI
jgi:hypothetical protein